MCTFHTTASIYRRKIVNCLLDESAKYYIGLLETIKIDRDKVFTRRF